MTPHRTLNIAAAVLLAVAIAVALSTSHLLDGPSDHSAEWAESTALADAQKVARLEARTERAAAQLCMRVKGPNAAYKWTPAGELVCTSNRGSNPVTVAKVAL